MEKDEIIMPIDWPVFIDLKLDRAFKRVFGTVGNEDLLLLLVNSILPEKHITSVTLGPQEHVGDTAQSKNTIYDVYCTTNDGSSLILEIQQRNKDDFAERMVYYSGFPIRDQISKGAQSYKTDDVYVIGILNFKLPEFMVTSDPINSFTYRNDGDSSKQLTTCSNMITVELPKFCKGQDELETMQEKLMYCFRYQSTFREIPPKLKCPELEKLFGISNFAAMSKDEQAMYLKDLMDEIDRKSELRTAQNIGREEGREEGRAEGRAEGVAQGRAEGIAQGRAETARSMKADNVPVEVISKYTGLTPEQIESL